MNDANSQTDDLDEITLLKARADTMGITYNPRIGIEALSAKIDKALKAGTSEPEEEEEETLVKAPVKKVQTEDERRAQVRKNLIADQMRLVRIRITNLNPLKKDLHGEIFTIANKYLGNVKKFIPYGEVTENGYHVPFVIYTEMKARKFLNIRTRTDKRTGEPIVETNWVSEFALDLLDPLTKEELAELARTQAAAGGVA